MSREYDRRLHEFAESNEAFARKGVAELIVDTGERLAALCLHDQVVGEAMIGLHRNFGLPDLPSHYVGERSWRTLWAATPSIDLATLPLAQTLTSLNAYAFYGLSPRSESKVCELDDIENVVSTVQRALETQRRDRAGLREIERTLLAAEARLGLDLGDEITPERLAALCENRAEEHA